MCRRKKNEKMKRTGDMNEIDRPKTVNDGEYTIVLEGS